MLVVGAKGFAKELLDILIKNKEKDIVFYDDVTEDIGEKIFDKFKILRNTDEAKSYLEKDARFTIGIGNPKLRKLLYEKFILLGGYYTSTISNFSDIGTFGVEIGDGCNILSGVRISNDCKIGKGTIIYYNSIITHDVEVGDFVEISPGAILLGRCKIGNGTHISAGSIIFPDIEIGENVIVAAGSVVRENIPDNVMVAGIPAVIKKQF